MQMCNAYSMILVPLYDTLGCEAVQHILNTTKIRTVIVDSKRLAMLLEYLTPDCSLKTVVLSDASPTEDDQVYHHNLSITSLDNLSKTSL